MRRRVPPVAGWIGSTSRSYLPPVVKTSSGELLTPPGQDADGSGGQSLLFHKRCTNEFKPPTNGCTNLPKYVTRPSRTGGPETRSPGPKGERDRQLLRFPHPREAFFFVAILDILYFVLFLLATTFGIGIAQHVVSCGTRLCAVFDFSPVLWLPVVAAGAAMPNALAGVPSWLLLSAVVARAATYLARPLMAPVPRVVRQKPKAAKPAKRVAG